MTAMTADGAAVAAFEPAPFAVFKALPATAEEKAWRHRIGNYRTLAAAKDAIRAEQAPEHNRLMEQVLGRRRQGVYEVWKAKGWERIS